jgi:hypothetical protein
VFTVNGQNIPLVSRTTTVGGVTYTVTLDGSGNGTVTVTDATAPGFSQTDAQAMVNNATYANSASPATAEAAGPSLEHQFKALLDLHRPALVINAAAYTAVDRAETEVALAMAVNGHVARNRVRTAGSQRRRRRACHSAASKTVARPARGWQLPGAADQQWLPGLAAADRRQWQLALK